MSWKDVMLFIGDHDCKVVDDRDGLIIICKGKQFLVSIDQDFDLNIKELI